MDLVKSADSGLDTQEIPCVCSQRWILGYLGFLCGAIFSILRNDINIAIVCMAGEAEINTTDYLNTSVTGHDGIPLPSDGAILRNDVCTGEIEKKVDTIEPEFVWDRGIQSHILSAYFYGFVASQIPSSWFIGKFGGKKVVVGFLLASSIATLLIPLLARVHVYAVIAARVLVGVTSAPLPSAWISLVGKWALANERSRLMMMFWCGKNLGAIFCYATSGFLCAYGFDNGWGSIFYLHGTIGIGFILVWAYFTSNSPETHPRITERERKVLVKRLQTTPSEHVRVPWTKMITSTSVWSIFITQLLDNSSLFLIVICLPLFAKEVLRFDIESVARQMEVQRNALRNMIDTYTATSHTQIVSPSLRYIYAKQLSEVCWTTLSLIQLLPMICSCDVPRHDQKDCHQNTNGIYTSLPFITRSASMVCASVLADHINSKKWVSRTCNRKIFQLTSFLGSAAFLILASYIPCDERQIVILFICFSTFFQSIALASGFPCNLVDMTPRYASYIYSVSNTIGACGGFLVPLGVTYLTQHKSMEEWRFVFWLFGGMAVLGCIVYGIFSSSELVSWDATAPLEIELEIIPDEKNALIGQVNSSDKPIDNIDKDTHSKTLQE